MSVFDVVRSVIRSHGSNPDGSRVNRVNLRYNDGSGSTVRGSILGIPDDHSPSALRAAAVTYGVVVETREHVSGELQVRTPAILHGAAAGVVLDGLTGIIDRVSDIPKLEGGMTVPSLPLGPVTIPVSLEDFGVPSLPPVKTVPPTGGKNGK